MMIAYYLKLFINHHHPIHSALDFSTYIPEAIELCSQSLDSCFPCLNFISLRILIPPEKDLSVTIFATISSL